MTTEARYYVSSNSYVGPDEGRDDDVVVISTRPCRTNSSHEERIEGWCGTTNNMSLTAHGVFESLAAAKTYAEDEILDGDFREIYAGGEPEDADFFFDPDVVAAYRIGDAPTMTPSESVDWMLGFGDTDITKDTTDDQIVEMARSWSEESVEHGGAKLDIDAVVLAAREYRDELGNEDEDEAA